VNGFALAGPLLRRLEPEAAHALTLWLLRRGFYPRPRRREDPRLQSRIWGLDFANPLGLAAGFDKNAQAMGAMLRLGFGHVEVGSVTPRPQPGNPRPRVFRLPEDGAVINRLGFPCEGLAAVAARLAAFRATPAGRAARLGVNLGKNKDSRDAAADYAAGAAALAPFADFLVINVSSPNTPGLRALQDRAALEELVGRVRRGLHDAGIAPPPLLVKIAPDLTEGDLADIAAVARGPRIDGLIVGNTTVQRPPDIVGRHRAEAGGLSGRPLFALSTEVLSRVYRLTEGRVPLIGVGGVADAADAYAKIRAGASLVQLYTALIYQGPGLVPRIAAGLSALLARDGFATVAEAVGADHR